MLRALIFLVLCFQFLYGIAQKPLVTKHILDEFPIIGNRIISNDGSAIAYWYELIPEHRLTVIQRVNDDWKRELTDVEGFFFTSNNRFFYFKRKDSLFKLFLGTNEIKFVASISSWRHYENELQEWLVYKTSNISEDCYVVRNLKTNQDFNFPNTNDLIFAPDMKSCVVNTEAIINGKTYFRLRLINFISGNEKNIWSSADSCDQLNKVVFDKESAQIAFSIKKKIHSKVSNSIWVFRPVLPSAQLLVNDASEGISNSLFVSDREIGFSDYGSHLFFSVQGAPIDRSKLGIDIWSYNDAVLQSAQIGLIERNPSDCYRCIVSLKDKHINQLEDEECKIFMRDYARDGNNNGAYEIKAGSCVLLQEKAGRDGESLWNKRSFSKVFVFDLNTNSKKLLLEDVRNEENVLLSPDGRYVLYFDYRCDQWSSYNCDKGEWISINGNNNWRSSNEESPMDYYLRGNILGWFQNESAVLITDHFNEVWKLFYDGNRAPICLSRGFAKKTETSFIGLAQEGFNSLKDYLPELESLYVTGINQNQKIKSLYKLTYDRLPQSITDQYGPQFKKAKNKNVYLLEKGSANEFPNLFITSDFDTYKQITDLQPEKEFNWYSCQVIKWKTFNGTYSSGILYKPENFDSSKKYPVIFQYYDNLSSGGNFYVNQSQIGETKEFIPLVSNGYLLFQPVIHYFPSCGAGESAVNSIVSAARHLAKLPYVDSRHMAITGHSFGGYETNFIITRTNLFAAALAANGMTDMTASFYLSSRDYNDIETTMPQYTELGQPRIGETTLWERPDMYIRNSPIYYADKVNTPLLMINNKDDHVVQFQQGYQFFSALRMLGKRVWMLQYDGGHHGYDGNDLQIRMKQFFDHYLKGAPAPIWMTRGIPARMKGKTYAYEYDSIIKTPGAGLNMQDDPKNLNPERKELLKHKTTVRNDGRIEDVIDDKKKVTMKR